MNFTQALGRRAEDVAVFWTALVWKMMWLSGLVIMAMFFLNGLGSVGMTINLVIFLLGTVFILLAGSSLPAVGTAFLGGGIFEALQDRDASQGTVKGLNALGRLVLLVSIVWILVAGTLSTIPFGWNIWSFLVISVASIAGVVVNQYAKLLQGKWLAWGILIYAVAFAVIALMNLWDPGRALLQRGQETITDAANWASGEQRIKSDKEVAQDVKRIEQNGELAAAQAAADAKVAAAASEAARVETERAKEEAMRLAQIGPCLRKNKDKLNCTTVTFGPGPDTYYDRQAPERHCILPDVKPSYDPNSEGFREINLGGGQKRYLGPSGLTVQFFDLKEGESFKGGKPCRIED